MHTETYTHTYTHAQVYKNTHKHLPPSLPLSHPLPLLACSLIFWKQSSTGTLGMLWILLRETRHTWCRLCLRATLAKLMMELAKWCTIRIAWFVWREGKGRKKLREEKKEMERREERNGRERREKEGRIGKWKEGGKWREGKQGWIEQWKEEKDRERNIVKEGQQGDEGMVQG